MANTRIMTLLMSHFSLIMTALKLHREAVKSLSLEIFKIQFYPRPEQPAPSPDLTPLWAEG